LIKKNKKNVEFEKSGNQQRVISNNLFEKFFKEKDSGDSNPAEVVKSGKYCMEKRTNLVH